MVKQQRNAQCACGSGKRYKHCCLDKHRDAKAPDISDLVREAGIKGLEHIREVRDEAERTLERLLIDPRATSADRLNASFSLINLAQRRGDHHDALVRLDAITVHEPSHPYLQALNLRAISLTQLGSHSEAAAITDDLLMRPKAADSPAFAWWKLEAGRTYHLAGRTEDAIRVTEDAIVFFKNAKNEMEHLTRAESNLAIFKLKSTKEEEIDQAERALERTCDIKIAIGDSEGASTNFSQLSIHHFRRGRFEKAIAYGRKDLKLSRLVGDDRAVASTLGNMAGIYMHLWQLSDARRFNRETAEIGGRLNNPNILEKAAAVARQIEEAGRYASAHGIQIGKNAECACRSGKKYVDCCGRADHEPVALRMPIGGFSEDLGDIKAALKSAGHQPLTLDFAMRDTDEARQRISWSQMHGHDGWFEIFELPDMANIHLNAAESLAKTAAEHEDAISEPIACAMLAVSALEAFINSTVYFANEARKSRDIALPPELLADAFLYQRRTELSQKWDALGRALCSVWPPPAPLWSNFLKLVQLRNELVHYKAEGFTRVAPATRDPPEPLRGLPSEIVLRDLPTSWPVRLLTPSFARWSVTVAKDLMRHFRTSYRFVLPPINPVIDQ
jgi:tetratricopeptide (TPR) repeat protein